MSTHGELTPEVAVALVRAGMSQTAIGEQYGISQPAVAYHLKKAGYQTPRAIVRSLLPWKGLTGKFKDATQYHRVTDHLVWVTEPDALSEELRERLARFYDMLEEFNYVVEFNPTIPPTLHQRSGGWRYVERRDTDENLIIRVNKYTKLPPTRRDLFRIPEVRPE